MKLCQDISTNNIAHTGWLWCAFIIFRTSLLLVFLLVFLFYGFLLVFFSIGWYFFYIQIDDKPLVEATAANWEDSMSIHNIDKSNEGKKVHLTGDTTTDYVVNDFLFGIELSDVIKLKRVVEKFDGQNWSNTTSPINSEIFRAKLVKLGTFTLSSELIDEMNTFKKLPITKDLFAQIPDNLSNELGGELHLNDDNYFVGQNPAFPQVGDLRIRFFVISTGTVSITAKQVGSHLIYHHQSTKEIIFTFLKKINPVNTTYYLSVFYQILPHYFLSFFSISFGIYLISLMLKGLINNFPSLFNPRLADNPYIFILIFTIAFSYVLLLVYLTLGVISTFYHYIFYTLDVNIVLNFILGAITALTAPLIIYVIGFLLSKLLKFIPFFDDFINWLNWLFAIIIAISISFIFIAITWINYLPILSIFFFIMAILNLYYSIPAAHRLLTVPNYEPPEPPLVQEMVVPQKV